VKWLGEIPSHWEAITLKRVFIRRIAGSWGEDENKLPKNSVCLRIADFDYGKLSFKTKEEYTIRSYFEDEVENKHLIKGDILIEKSGGGEKTPVGRCVMYDLDIEKPMYANFMEKLVCQNMANPKFINYLMSSLYTCGVIWPYVKATTGIQNLDITSLLQKETVYLPSLSEQSAIVAYLDTATAKIDAAIAQQQKMIDLLNERKQIIINRAVTKGLNSNAKMKDSGVEWIGEVQKHWEMRRLKTILDIKDRRNSDPNAVLLSVYTAIGVKPRKELEEKGNKASTVIDYKIVNKGDLIVNRLLAWMGAFGLSKYDGVTSPDYDVYSFKDGNNKEFYETMFRNTQFKSDCYKYGHGIMMMRWRTYPDEFLNIIIPVPPEKEQNEILQFLMPQINRIDQGVDNCNRIISLLQERKQIIINEVVTGKIKVV
jgi:type I restriction enzyme S subunit